MNQADSTHVVVGQDGLEGEVVVVHRREMAMQAAVASRVVEYLSKVWNWVE
jgi:hypothetical protein